LDSISTLLRTHSRRWRQRHTPRQEGARSGLRRCAVPRADTPPSHKCACTAAHVTALQVTRLGMAAAAAAAAAIDAAQCMALPRSRAQAHTKHRPALSVLSAVRAHAFRPPTGCRARLPAPCGPYQTSPCGRSAGTAAPGKGAQASGHRALGQQTTLCARLARSGGELPPAKPKICGRSLCARAEAK
jgi:hypothetical protein